MLNNKDFIKSLLKNLIDDLNRLLLLVFAILLIVTIFVRNFFLDITKILILIIFIFRLTSKDKIARRRENQKYINIKKIIFKPFSILKRNIKDYHKYVYKKCSKCKTTLKLPLPSQRGINHAKCPKCNNSVTLFTLRKKKPEKIKVEVIKKNK